MNLAKYGYWVEPSGDLIPVGFQEHDNEAIKVGFYKKPTLEALLSGYIRIKIYENEVSISFCKINSKQYKSVKYIMEGFYHYKIFIDFNGKIYCPKNSFELERILSINLEY